MLPFAKCNKLFTEKIGILSISIFKISILIANNLMIGVECGDSSRTARAESPAGKYKRDKG